MTYYNLVPGFYLLDYPDYLPPEGPPLCCVWKVAWLNFPRGFPFGEKPLLPENIDGFLGPKFKVGILGTTPPCPVEGWLEGSLAFSVRLFVI